MAGLFLELGASGDFPLNLAYTLFIFARIR